ncbi:MAG: tetracycline resistance MFS efflux pump, partial [Vicinamibacterales bacterium]
AGFAFGAAGMFVYGVAPGGGWFLAGVPLTALYGVATPAWQSLMTRRVAASEQGQLQGANGSLLGIAAMLAPLMFTQVFAQAVNRVPAPAASGLPFLLAGGLLAAAVVVSWQATKG